MTPERKTGLTIIAITTAAITIITVVATIASALTDPGRC